MGANLIVEMSKQDMSITPHAGACSSGSASKVERAEQLRRAGLRPTRQRVAIAAILLDGRHRHVTADSLADEIAKAGLQVAGATIYNCLNQFTDAGLLRRVMVRRDYSVFDTNIAHHHHFYEAAADRLIDIPGDELALAHLPSAPNGHEISRVDVIINIQPKVV